MVSQNISTLWVIGFSSVIFLGLAAICAAIQRALRKQRLINFKTGLSAKHKNEPPT